MLSEDTIPSALTNAPIVTFEAIAISGSTVTVCPLTTHWFPFMASTIPVKTTSFANALGATSKADDRESVPPQALSKYAPISQNEIRINRLILNILPPSKFMVSTL
ncbi:MAG: hypothetical protein B6D38_10155 [Anaerolineae bacterium UTCFX1]|nr:MAG: hypothetical protein B6D38_10155 [Anaerolineae bacterium UTCFX1]